MFPAEFYKFLKLFRVKTGGGSGGDGDVVGPASSVDKTIPRYSGITGKLIDDSGVVIDDSDNVNTQGFVAQRSEPSAAFTTSVTIDAGNITARTLYFNPTNASQVFTLPTAADLYAAMGALPLNTSLSTKFINKNLTTPVTLANSDFNLAGMPSLIIAPGQTAELEFQISDLTPLEITINGGNLSAQNSLINKVPNIVYVSDQGFDIAAADGSYLRPYATGAYVLTRITTASSTNPYTVVLSGRIVETQNVNLKAYISFTASSSGCVWDLSGHSLIATNGAFEVFVSNLKILGTILTAGGSGSARITYKNCDLNSVTAQTCTVVGAGSVQLTYDNCLLDSKSLTISIDAAADGVVEFTAKNNSRFYQITLDDQTGGRLNSLIFDSSSVPSLPFVIPSGSAFGNFQVISTTFNYKTSNSIDVTSVISAQALIDGLIKSTPTGNITLTFPTAADLVTALGVQALPGYTFSVKIGNFTATPGVFVIINKTDANVSFSNVSATTLYTGTTFDLDVTITDIATPAYMVSGGIALPQFPSGGIPSLSGDNIWLGRQTFKNTTIDFESEFSVGSSFTLTPAATLSKIITIPSVVGAPINIAWCDAASLAEAILSPAIKSTVHLKIVNDSLFPVTMVNVAGDVMTVSLFGGNSVVIPSGGELDVRLVFTAISTPQYLIVGANNPLMKSVAPLFIDVVANASYQYFKAPYAGKINSISSKCLSGTCTATVTINGTPVTATPNSVSSTNQDQAVTGANTFAAGDYITVDTSSNVACVNMAISVFYTYRNN